MNSYDIEIFKILKLTFSVVNEFRLNMEKKKIQRHELSFFQLFFLTRKINFLSFVYESVVSINIFSNRLERSFFLVCFDRSKSSIIVHLLSVFYKFQVDRKITFNIMLTTNTLLRRKTFGTARN